MTGAVLTHQHHQAAVVQERPALDPNSLTPWVDALPIPAIAKSCGDAARAWEWGGESSVLPCGDARVRNESASGNEADADVGIWRDISRADV